ncbi:MAG: phosphate/phosphite/phosphonate ABC transporter substrate-binding protein, partial [candidate division Zixibacteria bacterium]|nr:phosphate/phosphite/phosphonate ABC transporter substrate-binding protein [candidate division Zixibacteria bacterium]
FIMIGIIIASVVGCNSGDGKKKVDLNDRVSDSELRSLSVQQDEDVLVFGFQLRRSPQEEARQYVTFLKYLERSTDYKFALHFTMEDGRIVDDLGKGVVQFAAVGAGSYLLAQEKYGVVLMARGLNTQGRAEYRSVIVVAPHSPIQQIEDLRGKRFAFGSVVSTRGHLIPRISLFQHGMTLKDLASHEYTGSHRNCAEAVVKGYVDAGGMQDVLGMELEDAGIVRIIYTSEYYPSSGIAANKDVPTEVLEKVKEALLDFQPNGRDSVGLYNWDKTEMPKGFVEAHDEDYMELSIRARKLGIIGDDK